MALTAKISNDNFFYSALPAETVTALKLCAEVPFFKDTAWYLAGGTALALQVGNRKSVDLDFFTTSDNFDIEAVEKILSTCGATWTTDSKDKGTLYATLAGAKISLIAYPFFAPSVYENVIGNINLATPADIAVMKLTAISQRGKKRDFFDMYWLCKNGDNLLDIFVRMQSQYKISQNTNHLIRSLVHFVDAEDDPDPVIYFDATWDEVKTYFETEITKIAKELIGLK